MNKELDIGWSESANAEITIHAVYTVQGKPESRDLIGRMVFCDGIYDETFRRDVLKAYDALTKAYETWSDGYIEVRVSFVGHMVNG